MTAFSRSGLRTESNSAHAAPGREAQRTQSLSDHGLMGTQELHRGPKSCLCARRVLPLSLQGLGLFDRRCSGTAVAVRGERDETLGGELVAHVLEAGCEPPPSVQDEHP